MVKEAPIFWVTNISNRNVTLADLALNIKAMTSVNLLDKKHYNYTLEQLTKSKESGSLFHKKDMILIRQTAAVKTEYKIPVLHNTFIPSRERSVLVIKEEHYEELNVSGEDQKKKDEQYAEENAEYAEMDQSKPIINTKG